jgi:hypothetical protein
MIDLIRLCFDHFKEGVVVSDPVFCHKPMPFDPKDAPSLRRMIRAYLAGSLFSVQEYSSKAPFCFRFAGSGRLQKHPTS